MGLAVNISWCHECLGSFPTYCIRTWRRCCEGIHCTVTCCQLLAELVLVGTEDTAYCFSVQFPIAYLQPNLYGPCYKRVNPKEFHSYYATVVETAAYVLDSIEGIYSSFEWRLTSERRKLIPLESYSCFKVTAAASAEWPRKWQFTLSVKLLSCAIRILELTDGKGNMDSIANPFITYLRLVFLPPIRSYFDGKHF